MIRIRRRLIPPRSPPIVAACLETAPWSYLTSAGQRFRSFASRASGVGATPLPGSSRKHGDAKLTDLLQTLADCPKTESASIHDRCKAVYEGLRAR
jgi:hypothetical protein